MALTLKNPVRERLLAGKVSMGTWCVSGSPLAAEVVAGAGFEWVILDIEHYPIDVAAAAECFRAIQLMGAMPLARLPACDPTWIKRSLDAGAMGILVPLLRSADDARNVVAWSRFPPLGRRPFGGGRASLLYDGYLAQANQAVLVMVQIETAEAVDNLDAILAVGGYDGCFVGPADLSLSLGMPPYPAPHPPRDELVRSLARRIRSAGKVAGTISASPQDAAARIREGYQMVSVLSDLGHLRNAATRAVAELTSGGPARAQGGP